MRAMAEAEGAGYIVRSEVLTPAVPPWKAGNLNNALLDTQGKRMLDADQLPNPVIPDRTLGYFRDPSVSTFGEADVVKKLSELRGWGRRSP